MSGTVPAPKSLLVTGASSGLGRALAEAYAGPGVSLALGGRDAVRLNATVETCWARGAAATGQVIDVTDAQAMTRWVEAADDDAPLDLVIANAGVSGGTGGRGEDAAQTRRIMATNVDGTMNTVLPALPRMRARASGQVAVISSLAGLTAMPGAPAYSASKAAVQTWGESLRAWLAGDGVHVSVVCPGFIDTPLTQSNRYKMPYLMSADAAAAIIRRGLARDTARIAFPWQLYLLMRVFRALPPSVGLRILSRGPRKD